MPQVKVAQTDGEITVQAGASEPVTYKVSGGTVQVKQGDLEHFLKVVDGASVASTGKE